MPRTDRTVEWIAYLILQKIIDAALIKIPAEM